MAVTVTSVTILSPTQVLLDTTEMTQGKAYTLTVANVKDQSGIVIEPAYASLTFAGIGDLPKLSSIIVHDPSTLYLTFNHDMLNNTALTLSTNYVVTGASTPTVGPINIINATTVSVTVSEMLTLGAYTITVSNVLDSIGNVIDPVYNSINFSGVGVAPQVVPAAAAIDSTSVRITFNEFMTDNAALVDNANYTITGPTVLTKGIVTPQGGPNHNEVVIAVSEMKQAGVYRVDVSTTLTDLIGNTLDPAAAFATWVGIGVAPAVSSAAFVDSTHCTVTFSETMDPTTAQTAGNYVLSGPSSPVTSVAVHVAGVTTLTLATPMVNGDYTITTTGVTDVAGNMISPNPGTPVFTATVVVPQDVVLWSLGDTWEWEGTGGIWTQRAIGGVLGVDKPDLMYSPSMAYDIVNKKAILFGGYNGGTYYGKTWEWDGIAKTWTQRAIGGVPGVDKPTGRHRFAMAYDGISGKIVLFGGWDSVGWVNDTWEYMVVTGTWAKQAPVGPPSARQYCVATYDESRGKVLLFGGNDGGLKNDTWEWDGTLKTWTDRTPGTLKPSGRQEPILVYDPTTSLVVMFGGLDGAGRIQDTWEWNGTTQVWTERATGAVTKPSARYHIQAAYDKDRSVVILQGGDTAGGTEDDHYQYNSTTHAWTLVSAGPAPGAYYAGALSGSGV